MLAKLLPSRNFLKSTMETPKQYVRSNSKKLTKNITDRRHWSHYDIIYFMHCSGVSIVDFEQVNTG